MGLGILVLLSIMVHLESIADSVKFNGVKLNKELASRLTRMCLSGIFTVFMNCNLNPSFAIIFIRRLLIIIYIYFLN